MVIFLNGNKNKDIGELKYKMTGASFMDWALTFFVLGGVFLAIYMAWRQQGILETVNEIKDAFEDRAEDVADGLGGVYR